MNSFIDSNGVIEHASLTLQATRHGTDERREHEAVVRVQHPATYLD